MEAFRRRRRTWVRSEPLVTEKLYYDRAFNPERALTCEHLLSDTRDQRLY